MIEQSVEWELKSIIKSHMIVSLLICISSLQAVVYKMYTHLNPLWSTFEGWFCLLYCVIAWTDSKF